jgi:hypothetical protein
VHTFEYKSVTPGADDEDIREFYAKLSLGEGARVSCNSTQPSPQCVRSSERYRWKPATRDRLGIERVDRGAFCDIMWARGVRRISFYGDSMTRSMVHSLWALLGFTGFLSPCPRDREEGCLQTVPCGNYPSVVVHQIRERDTGAVRDNVTNLVRSIELADITVMNFGAHYVPLLYNDSFSSAFQAYVEDMGTLATAVRKVLQQAPHKRIIFRSSPLGHAKCDQYKRLAPSTRESQDATARAWEDCEDCRGGWGWTLFPAYDRIARDILEPAGANFLDVSTLSNQRPDAHTAFRHGGGRLPPDCLHFSLPGVPDWWNALLLSAIQRCVPPRQDAQ